MVPYHMIQDVTHPSTDCAQCRLTSVTGQEEDEDVLKTAEDVQVLCNDTTSGYLNESKVCTSIRVA
jgi:hypothetical protein